MLYVTANTQPQSVIKCNSECQTKFKRKIILLSNWPQTLTENEFRNFENRSFYDGQVTLFRTATRAENILSEEKLLFEAMLFESFLSEQVCSTSYLYHTTLPYPTHYVC